MPSSFMWIGLVAVWLFVLVPMLVNKRPTIRQTSDAALATRVLHRGDSNLVQRGPAAGHRSDPNWQPEPMRSSYDAEDPMDTHAGYDYSDARAPVGEFVPVRRGRGGFDPEADAIAREARYAFRQRTLLGLAFLAIMTGALALIISPVLWWTFVLTIGGLGGYLAYLRRQVRIEQEIRRRRTERLNRSRLGVESHTDEELRLIPSRLRRPGAVVLEVDDEDPVFDHLNHYDEMDAHVEMRRASGQ